MVTGIERGFVGGYTLRLKGFEHVLRVLIYSPVQTNIRNQNLARDITGVCKDAP